MFQTCQLVPTVKELTKFVVVAVEDVLQHPDCVLGQEAVQIAGPDLLDAVVDERLVVVVGGRVGE